jgi:hypothetical protein
MSERPLDPEAVRRGAFAGFLALLPVVLVIAILERELDEFDTSAWAALAFLLLLLVFALAGWIAGATSPAAPLTNGSLAGLGTFALWIPLRILIWAVRGGQGLVSGDDPVLNPGAILVLFVFSGCFGMIGALLAARRKRDNGGGESAGRSRPVPTAQAEERPDSEGQGAG